MGKGVIYSIGFKDEDKPFYVGQTRQKPNVRWRKHMTGRTPVSKFLQLFGAANMFDFRVIEEIDDIDLNEREKYWIDTLRTIHPYGLNHLSGGTVSTHSNSTRAKISEANALAWADEALRSRQSGAVAELWADPEYRDKVVTGMKRAWADPALRKAHSRSTKTAWKNPQRRAEQSARVKAAWQNPEYRALQRERRAEAKLRRTASEL